MKLPALGVLLPALAALAAPAAVQSAFAASPPASGGVCGVDYYGPCLPDANPPQRPSAPTAATDSPVQPNPGGALDQSAFDALALTSQDGLSRSIEKAAILNPEEAASDVIRVAGLSEKNSLAGLDKTSGGLLDAPANAARRAGGASAQPVEAPSRGLDGPFGTQVSAPIVVYLPGVQGAFEGTGRSPNAFNQLTVMSRRLQKSGPLEGNTDGLALRMNHAWGLDTRLRGMGVPIRRGSSFFGL